MQLEWGSAETWALWDFNSRSADRNEIHGDEGAERGMEGRKGTLQRGGRVFSRTATNSCNCIENLRRKLLISNIDEQPGIAFPSLRINIWSGSAVSHTCSRRQKCRSEPRFRRLESEMDLLGKIWKSIVEIGNNPSSVYQRVSKYFNGVSIAKVKYIIIIISNYVIIRKIQ